MASFSPPHNLVIVYTSLCVFLTPPTLTAWSRPATYSAFSVNTCTKWDAGTRRSRNSSSSKAKALKASNLVSMSFRLGIACWKQPYTDSWMGAMRHRLPQHRHPLLKLKRIGYTLMKTCGVAVSYASLLPLRTRNDRVTMFITCRLWLNVPNWAE